MPLTLEQKRQVLRANRFDPDTHEYDEATGDVFLKDNSQPTATQFQGAITKAEDSVSSTIAKNAALSLAPTVAGGFAWGKVGAPLGARIGGAIAGRLAGAKAGAIAGAPAGPWGAGIGAILGGVAAGAGASYLASKAQEKLLPEEALQNVAQSSATNPNAAMVGSAIPFLAGAGGLFPGPNVLRAAGDLTMRGTDLLTKNARVLTAAERAAQNLNMQQVATGAALMPAISAGHRLAVGEELQTPGEAAYEALLGAVYNRPNTLGNKMGFHSPTVKKTNLEEIGENVALLRNQPKVEGSEPTVEMDPYVKQRLLEQEKLAKRNVKIEGELKKQTDATQDAAIKLTLADAETRRVNMERAAQEAEAKRTEALKLREEEAQKRSVKLEMVEEPIEATLPKPEKVGILDATGETMGGEQMLLKQPVEAQGTLRSREELIKTPVPLERGVQKKYSNESEVPPNEMPRVIAEVKANAAKLKALGDRTQYNAYLMWIRKNFPSIKFTEVHQILNEKGEPMVGSSSGAGEVQLALTGGKDNLGAGFDTPTHEIFHEARARAKNDPYLMELIDVAEARLGGEETVAQKHVGPEFAKRILDPEQNSLGNYSKDFLAHMKERFGFASDADVVRLITRELHSNKAEPANWVKGTTEGKQNFAVQGEFVFRSPEEQAEFDKIVEGIRNSELEPQQRAQMEKGLREVRSYPPRPRRLEGESVSLETLERQPERLKGGTRYSDESEMPRKEDSQLEGFHAKFMEELKRKTDDLHKGAPSDIKKGDIVAIEYARFPSRRYEVLGSRGPMRKETEPQVYLRELDTGTNGQTAGQEFSIGLSKLKMLDDTKYSNSPEIPRDDRPFITTLEKELSTNAVKPLGLTPSKRNTVESLQLLNKLKGGNQAEWEMLKQAGIENYIKGKEHVELDGLREWVRENGQKLDAVSYGMEGKVSEAKRERDKLHGELDMLPRNQRNQLDTAYDEYLRNPKLGKDYINPAKYGVTKEAWDKKVRIGELDKQLENEPRDTSPRATSYYERVSALPTNEPMPEWTTSKSRKNAQRVDVVIPRKQISTEERINQGDVSPDSIEYGDKGTYEKSLWQPDNLHENLPNTPYWNLIQYKTRAAKVADRTKPVAIVGIGNKGYAYQLQDILRDPNVPDWVKQKVQKGEYEHYDMHSMPERGDVIDALDRHSAVVGHHIYGLTGSDVSVEPSYYYNRENSKLLEKSHNKGLPVYLKGEQPDGKNVTSYVEHAPKGKKIALIAEGQGSWIQAKHAYESALKKGKTEKEAYDASVKAGSGRGYRPNQDHPLLQHAQRLGMKAAIKQAHKEGATHIMVSDAETAMMTEGHDVGARNNIHIDLTKLTPKQIDTLRDEGFLSSGSVRERQGNRDVQILDLNRVTSKSALKDLGIPEKAIVKEEISVEQEPGMRLNYDTILPKITEELTGSKGERVSLGEHKNAYSDVRHGEPFDAQGNHTPFTKEQRENLIFKNPDGTPKTDVSGMMYPLEAIGKRLESGEKMTLTGKKYSDEAEIPLTEETASKELKDAFAKVHNQQRWQGPESMFSTASNPDVDFGTGGWTNSLEHGGDLIHRLSYSGSKEDFGGGGSWYGRGAALSKAKSLLNSFEFRKGWMPFGQDVQEQWKSNYESRKKSGKFVGTEREFLTRLTEAGERYSQEYQKLTPVTEPQKLGRDIAIDIGHFDFQAAVPKLKRLISLLEADNWEANYWKPLADKKYSSDPEIQRTFEALGPDKDLPGFKVKAAELAHRFSGEIPGIGAATETLRLTQGREGALAADAFNEMEVAAREYYGKTSTKMLELMRKMDDEEMRMWEATMLKGDRYHIDTSGELTTDAQRAATAEWHRIRKMTHDDAVAADQPVWEFDPNTGEATARVRRENPNYFKQVMSSDAMDVLQNHKGSLAAAKYRKAFVEYQKKWAEMGEAEANKMLDGIIESFSSTGNVAQEKFNALSKAEGYGLPDEMLEKNPLISMKRYLSRFAKGRAFHDQVETSPDMLKIFGRNFDAWGRPSSPVDASLVSLAGNARFDPLVEFMQGRTAKASPRIDALSSLVNNLILGPVGASSDLVTTPGNMSKFVPGLSDLPGLYKHMVTGMKEGYDAAKRQGIIKDSLRDMTDTLIPGERVADWIYGVSDFVGKFSGRQGIEKWGRGASMAMAQYLIPMHLKLAETGNANSLKLLKGLANNRDYTKLSVEQLAGRLVEIGGQGTYGTRGLPLWMLDSQLAPFFKLAKWNVEQTHNFYKHVLLPAARGENYTPLFATLIGGTIGGYMAKELREFLNNKKTNVPGFAEILAAPDDTEQLPAIVYNYAAAAAYGGYAGLIGDLAKSGMDVAYKNRPAGFNYPLAEIGGDAAAHITAAISAIENGEDILKVMPELSKNLFAKNIQIGRVAYNWLGDSEKREDTAARRDLRVFNQLSGNETPNMIIPRPDYEDLDTRAFKKTSDIGEAVEMLPDLMSKAIEKAKGNPERLKQELRKMKSNSYQTMPNPETMPLSFAQYVIYLQKTKGDEKASEALVNYFQRNAVNKAKSSLVPSF